MVEYNTLKEKVFKFGNNNFLEVSIRSLIDGDKEVFYISLSRGFINREGNKIYKKNFTLPYDKELLGEVIKELKEIESTMD